MTIAKKYMSCPLNGKSEYNCRPRIPVTATRVPVVIAVHADLHEAGDLVLRGNGEPIEGWIQWLEFLRARPGETVELEVLRDGRELSLTATLDTITEEGQTFGRIGASPPALSAEQRYGVVESLPRAVEPIGR